MCRQCAAHAFTISGICGIFAVTLIWIVQNCLQLLLCLVISIIEIHFCMVSWTLTPPNFNVFSIDWPRVVTNVPLLRSLHWLPVKFRILFKISSLTYKTIYEKQTVYLHSMLAPSLPSHSLRSCKRISLSVPRARPTQTQELFTLVSHLSGTTCHCLSIQPFQLLPSRNIWRHISDLAFPPLYTGTPYNLLIPRNCFINFAVEHWFGCCTTESGFAGDINVMKIWLIDWQFHNSSIKSPLCSVQESMMTTVLETNYVFLPAVRQFLKRVDVGTTYWEQVPSVGVTKMRLLLPTV